MKKIIYGIILSIYPLCFTISQQLIYNFGNNHIPTSAISFTPDGRLILVGGYAKFYDIELEKVDFRTIPKDYETQMDFSFDAILSPDKRTFLLTKINRVEIWDMQSRKIIRTLRDNQLIPTAVCFSGNSDIIYMRKKGEVVFVNASTYKETTINNISETPVSICLSPEGDKLLIGTKVNIIYTCDLSSRRLTNTEIDSKEKIDHIEFSPYGGYVAASSSDGRIWLGKYPSMEKVRSWQAHSEGQTTITFHPSGQYLASGGKDKMICIWRIPECSKISDWEAHKLPLASLAFSPSGTELASGSFNAVAISGDDTKLWTFKEPSQLSTLKNENVKSNLPDNKVLATQQTDNSTKKRIALLIGNGAYLNSILANPENDAREFKNELIRFGFDVFEYENLNQIQMKKAIDEFGVKLKNYDVGLFYYAGHGIQSKGINYLIPVDAILGSEQQIEYDCVQADRILGAMEASGAKVNIMILDACRNNPFERSWTRTISGKGLAYMNAPSGTLIAYATAPGSTASDGSGKNGLYTSAILESIKIPNLTILQMFQNVRSIVSQKSNKQQIPWESTSLTGDFYFYQVSQK
jgi:WD40 repeat protein